MNDLSLLAIAFMHATSADRVRTCYCYGSFSLLFKLMNLTRFILEFITELQVSENSTLSIHIYYRGAFVKIANAERVQSKPYRVLTPALPVTKKFEQKTG